MEKKTPVIQEKTINKRQLERLIIIHNAIKAGLYPNNKTLRQFYCEQTGYKNVSEATIQRDIDTLRVNFHAPIEYDAFKKGYYLLDSNYDFALNNISIKDIFYLSAAKTMLSSFEGTTVYDSIADVINFVTNTQCRGRFEMLNRIAVPPVPRIVMKDEKIWNQVLAAMDGNQIVEFDYSGRWSTATKHRRVHPYQVLLDQGRCFVFGYDENADGESKERLFALNRIKNLAVTDGTFELPEDYEFSSRCEGGRFGSFIGEGPVEFVVDFYGDAREYVKECIWADNQKLEEFEEEEKTRITLTTSQVLSVKEWVLAQGANAVPVSPDWFVEQWKDAVRGMVERAGL